MSEIKRRNNAAARGANQWQGNRFGQMKQAKWTYDEGEVNEATEEKARESAISNYLAL